MDGRHWNLHHWIELPLGDVLNNFDWFLSKQKLNSKKKIEHNQRYNRTQKKVAPRESLGLHSCIDNINGIPAADYNQQKKGHTIQSVV